MLPRIKAVRHVEEYLLEIDFTNGKSGIIDFRSRVVGRGGVFRPLEEVAFFEQVQIDRESGTLLWPNGVDLCPDALYLEATQNQELPLAAAIN